jgi:hypothetical protein
MPHTTESRIDHHTWRPHLVGHLLVTFQLDPPSNGQNLQLHPKLARLTTELINLMNSYRLPATWAVSDPAHSAATPQILRSAVEHELAILGDANWLGPTAGRTRFARELSRRVLQSRSAGLTISTLVPRVACVQQDIDLVVKHKLSAVAGIAMPPHSGWRLAPPLALHYGVWELPLNGRLPMQTSWLQSARRILWRRIRRTARDAATFHLLIDAPALESEGYRARKSIAWLMRRVSEFRERGLLRVQTLGRAAARLSDVPAAAPQRSILRVAA